MENLVFRNDDVTSNTDLDKLEALYDVIRDIFPYADIISCITLFSKKNNKGSVYSEVPFKNKPTNWFYKTNQFINFNLDKLPQSRIASHGLYHIDHSNVSYQTQEMSILGSCRYLNTNIFVPPFNRSNDDTVNICLDNSIELWSLNQGWKNIEYEPFDMNHRLWYFHSWRFTPNSLRNALYRTKDESGLLNK